MRTKTGLYFVIFLLCVNTVYSANFETTLSNHYGDGSSILLNYVIETFEGESDIWKIYAIKCILEPDFSCSMSSNLEKTEIKRIDITETIGSTDININSFSPWIYRICSSTNNGQDCDSDKQYLLLGGTQVVTKTETVYVETECECPEPQKVNCIYNATVNFPMKCPDCFCNCTFENLTKKIDNIFNVINTSSVNTKTYVGTNNTSLISLAVKKIDITQQKPQELNYYILLSIIGIIGLVVLLRKF